MLDDIISPSLRMQMTKHGWTEADIIRCLRPHESADMRIYRAACKTCGHVVKHSLRSYWDARCPCGGELDTRFLHAYLLATLTGDQVSAEEFRALCMIQRRGNKSA
jgi:hypothetical protein